MKSVSYRPTVYVETTVISYLTARLSRDVQRVSHQMITKEWWASELHRHDCVISDTVLDEISGGDPDAASERLTSVRTLPVLLRSEEVLMLAEEYFRLLELPKKAYNDAVHMAYSVVFRLDYLLTWNMRHMATALTMKRLTEYNLSRSLAVPLIVTPDYFFPDSDTELP